jgi:hypothetical protein
MYKGCVESADMLVKMSEKGPLGKRGCIQILVMSSFALLAVSCSSSGGKTEPTQSDLVQPNFTSPSPDLIIELTPTPTSARRTSTSTNIFQASSTPKPHVSPDISDELIPSDLTAVYETQIAYDNALLLTPSPTPTINVPLNEDGPWLVGSSIEGLIFMNLDGTGLIQMTIDGDWSFPWPESSSFSEKWVALETGNRPDTREVDLKNFPDDLAYRLLQIPAGQFERTIPLISSKMVSEIRQVDYRMPFPTIIDALFSSPIEWSPDGRYLAFAAALDGPSSDLYVYDTARDQIRRLTDGSNETFIMSWTPDSQWILHAEVTSYASPTVLIGGRPRAKAVWVASPDGSQVRKVYDVNDEVVQFQVWLSPSVYVEQMIMDYENYRFNINTVDIRSGEMTSIYPCFGSFTGITSDGEILFWSDESTEIITSHPQYTCNDPLPSGFYLFKDGNSIPFLQIPDNAKWNEALQKFIVWTSRGTEIWDLSGQFITTFSQEKCYPLVSPDGQWLAFWHPCDEDYQSDRRIRFYDPEGEMLQEHYLKADCWYWNPDTPLMVDCLYWNPDSSGIFLQDGSQLWYLSPQDSEPVLIHPDSGMRFPFVMGE